MAVTLLIVTNGTFVDKNLLILTASLFSNRKRSRCRGRLYAQLGNCHPDREGLQQSVQREVIIADDADDIGSVITCGRPVERH